MTKRSLGTWSKVDEELCTFDAGAPHALGLVFRSGTEIDDWWSWEARVTTPARWDTSFPIRGHAPTLEGAKRIVEVLLVETGTISVLPEQMTGSAQRLLGHMDPETVAELIDAGLEGQGKVTGQDVLRAIAELGRKAMDLLKGNSYPDPKR